MAANTTKHLGKEIKIRRAIDLLNTCPHKSKVVEIMKEEFKIGPRMIENYLTAARARILAAIGIEKQEHIADAYNFYKSIVTDEKVRPIDRIRAQEQIDRLLGLQQPQKVAPVTPDGDKSWQPENLDDLRSKIFERVTQLAQPSRQ
jgi:hypothetical protein